MEQVMVDLVLSSSLLALKVSVVIHSLQLLVQTAGGALPSRYVAYKSITAATTYKVFSKAGANATSAGNGFYLSDADVDANKKGYIVCEVCYIQPDEAPQYNDIEQYIIGRTVS